MKYYYESYDKLLQLRRMMPTRFAEQDKKFSQAYSETNRKLAEKIANQSLVDYKEYGYKNFPPSFVAECIHNFIYLTYDLFLIRPGQLSEAAFKTVCSIVLIEPYAQFGEDSTQFIQLIVHLIEACQAEGYLKKIKFLDGQLFMSVINGMDEIINQKPELLDDDSENMVDVNMSEYLDSIPLEDFDQFLTGDLPLGVLDGADKVRKEATLAKNSRLAKKMAARARATFGRYHYERLEATFVGNFIQYLVDVNYRGFLIPAERLTADNFAALFLGAAPQNYASIPVTASEFLKLAHQTVELYQANNVLKLTKAEEKVLFEYLKEELDEIEKRPVFDEWESLLEEENEFELSLPMSCLFQTLNLCYRYQIENSLQRFLYIKEPELFFGEDQHDDGQASNFNDLLGLWLRVFALSNERPLYFYSLHDAFELCDKMEEEKDLPFDFPKDYKNTMINTINAMENPFTKMPYDNHIEYNKTNFGLINSDGSKNFIVGESFEEVFVLRQIRATPRPQSNWKANTEKRYLAYVEQFIENLREKVKLTDDLSRIFKKFCEQFICRFYQTYRMPPSQITGGAVAQAMLDYFDEYSPLDVENIALCVPVLFEFFTWLGDEQVIKNSDSILSKIWEIQPVIYRKGLIKALSKK